MHLLIRSVAVGISLAAAVLAQSTHQVSGGGNALLAALQAAAPGDIFDVLPGNYFATATSRGARIELRPGAVLTTQFGSLLAGLTVTNLPVDEAVVVVGGRIDGFSFTDCAGAIVVDRAIVDATWAASSATNCTGPISLQDVSTPLTLAYGTLTITDCSQFSAHRAALARTTSTNSNLALAASTIFPYGGAWPPGQSPSLRIVGGSVFLTGGLVRGGMAASWPFLEPAIRIESGELVVTGGAVLQESSPNVPTSPAIDGVGGTVRIDPSVTLLGTPPIAGPATVTVATTPGLAVARSTGAAGYDVTATVEPSSLVFTLLALPTAPQNSPFGTRWLRPDALILDFGVADPQGRRVFTRSLAAVPPYLALTLQSASLSPTGTVAVGAPLRFVWD